MVFKLKDVRAALTASECSQLEHLASIVENYRIDEGKAPFVCAVVEADWPEYEPTWKAIEERVEQERKDVDFSLSMGA